MNNKNIKFILIILVVTLIGGQYVKNKQDKITYIEKDEISSTTDYKDLKREEYIKVYISGEVKNPDIYEVEKGLRVIDVIELAGGTTDNGDIKNINLAEYVEDAQHILIPSISGTIENITIEDIENQDIKANSKINLNKATKEELMTVNGIGEVTADKIILYREEHGMFTTVSELKEIKGIGDKTFDKMKDSFFIG